MVKKDFYDPVADGRSSNGWGLFNRRSLRTTNYRLVKAEREFIEGKRWPEIKVRFEYVDGSVIERPVETVPDKEAWPCCYSKGKLRRAAR